LETFAKGDPECVLVAFRKAFTSIDFEPQPI